MTSWRQPVRVPVGHRARWDPGNGVIWAERRAGQWLIGAPERTLEEPICPGFSLIEASAAPAEDGPPCRRVAVRGEARSIELVPRPPPRPIIARPELPLVVPPGQVTTVYVGVPLWIGLEDDGLLLHDVPAVRLSDTWFGTPVHGELCFATRTHLRMDLGEVPRVEHRALCVIDVRNDRAEALVLERVRLPAPSLSIYLDDEDRPWTSPVRLHRERGDHGHELTEVVAKSPKAGLRLVGPAREPLAAPLLGRVFNAVFSVGAGS
jgi:hypothetical protein